LNLSKSDKIFVLIIFAALIVRLFIVFFTELSWYGADSATYLIMAEGILNGNPISYFPNGYPIFIAFISLFTGSFLPVTLVLINILVQIITLIFVYKILKSFNVNDYLILIIVFIIALYPNQVSRTRFIMTEPISVLILVSAIYFYIKSYFFTAGLLGCILITFRPSLILFIPFLIVYELILKRRNPAAKIAAGLAIGILFFTMLNLAGITSFASNYRQNFLVAIQSFGYDINHNLNSYTAEEIDHPVKTYFSYSVSSPVNFAKQRIASLLSLWGPYVPSEYGLPGMILHGIRFHFFLLSLVAMIFYKKLMIDSKLIMVLAFPIISITLVQIMFFSTQRHQSCAEPFVVILGVIILFAIVSLKENHKNKISRIVY